MHVIALAEPDAAICQDFDLIRTMLERLIGPELKMAVCKLRYLPRHLERCREHKTPVDWVIAQLDLNHLEGYRLDGWDYAGLMVRCPKAHLIYVVDHHLTPVEDEAIQAKFRQIHGGVTVPYLFSTTSADWYLKAYQLIAENLATTSAERALELFFEHWRAPDDEVLLAVAQLEWIGRLWPFVGYALQERIKRKFEVKTLTAGGVSLMPLRA